jgi:hypothetical protein
VQRHEKDEKLDAAPTAKSEEAKPAQGVKAVEEKGRSCKMKEVWVIEKESKGMQNVITCCCCPSSEARESCKREVGVKNKQQTRMMKRSSRCRRCRVTQLTRMHRTER